MRKRMVLGDQIVFYSVPHEFEFTLSTGYDTFCRYAGRRGFPLLAEIFYVRGSEVDIILDPTNMRGIVTLVIDPSYENAPYLDLISL